MFYHQGGVDVGNVDEKAVRLEIGPDEMITTEAITETLLQQIPHERQEKVATFIFALYKTFHALHFAYLEINPLVFTEEGCVPLDLAAKLDQVAFRYLP